MLQIFLIGAALSHARPEPLTDDGLPADPLRFHRERWRTITGVTAFWRWRSRPKLKATASKRPFRPVGPFPPTPLACTYLRAQRQPAERMSAAEFCWINH